MSETSRSHTEDNGSVQYIDLVVERCLDKGRVAFKNAKQMGRVLQLQDFPSFVFEDWQKQKLLVPESSLLGQYAIVRAVTGGEGSSQQHHRTGSKAEASTLGYLVPNGEWLYAGAQWTAASTVGWGRWIFRMDDAKVDAAAICAPTSTKKTSGGGEEGGECQEEEEPLSARSEEGPAYSAEEKRIHFDSALTATRAEGNESFGKTGAGGGAGGGDFDRYVFTPALEHMVNQVNHHIVTTLPMIDTVMTCEEWGDLLLELGVLDGPVVTSQALMRQPVRFLELPEWSPPLHEIVDEQSSMKTRSISPSKGGASAEGLGGVDKKKKRSRLLNAAKGLVTNLTDQHEAGSGGVEQNKGGMLFTTSDYPEMEAAQVILFAKRLHEKMTTFIRTHEYKLNEAVEFARDTTEDSQERMALSKSEHLLEVNKLFQVHLTKTLKRLREQRTLSIEGIAEAIDADCLCHFPGDWPKQELGDELCV